MTARPTNRNTSLWMCQAIRLPLAKSTNASAAASQADASRATDYPERQEKAERQVSWRFQCTQAAGHDVDGNNAYGAATDFQVVVKTSYVNGNGYFTQTVTVTPPSTNTGVVKLYQTADTMLGGQDNGTGTSTAIGGNVSAIGVLGTNTGAEHKYLHCRDAGRRGYDAHLCGRLQWRKSLRKRHQQWRRHRQHVGYVQHRHGFWRAMDAWCDHRADRTVSYHIAFTGETTLNINADATPPLPGAATQ